MCIRDRNGNNAINIVSGAAEHLINRDIDNHIETIKNSEIFLTQMETPDETTIYALKKAKENGCTTILNPAPARKIDEENFKSFAKPTAKAPLNASPAPVVSIT